MLSSAKAELLFRFPKTHLHVFSGLVLAYLLVGCVPFPTVVYEPNPGTLSKMTFFQVRQALLASVKRGDIRRALAVRSAFLDTRDIKIEKDQVIFFNQQRKPEFIVFKRVKTIKVSQVGSYYLLNFEVDNPYRLYEFVYNGFDGVKLWADALSSLAQGLSFEARVEDTPFNEFKEKAKAWRALPVKPELPEEVNKYAVLAENATREKRHEDALDYFQKGLSVYPFWPEGQYNAAFLAGELEMYPDAIYHAKHYLELAPNAPNAQALRNRIIIWAEKNRGR